jgi:multiple antibiotic resistance protein
VFEKRTERKQNTVETAVTRDHIENLAAFPLAVPLMAGPGAITAVILLNGQASGDLIKTGVLVGCIIGIVLMCLTTFLLASRIEKWLGITGRVVITRLLGVILAALAVQFVADGIFGLLAGRA